MDLADLYQDVILDHGKNPRNRREMPDHTHSAEGYNPLCGDQITIWLRLSGDTVEDASFSGQGCAISQASASLMTLAVIGKGKSEAEELFGLFRSTVTDTGDAYDCHQKPLDPHIDGATEDDRLGELICLAGVRKYPNRIKCATLAWHALHTAMQGGESATTE